MPQGNSFLSSKRDECEWILRHNPYSGQQLVTVADELIFKIKFHLYVSILTLNPKYYEKMYQQ